MPHFQKLWIDWSETGLKGVPVGIWIFGARYYSIESKRFSKIAKVAPSWKTCSSTPPSSTIACRRMRVWQSYCPLKSRTCWVIIATFSSSGTKKLLRMVRQLWVIRRIPQLSTTIMVFLRCSQDLISSRVYPGLSVSKLLRIIVSQDRVWRERRGVTVK